MKRIYISDPMTGKKDFNRPAFEAAKYMFESGGFAAILPVDFVESKTYEEYLRDDLRPLLDCDGIYMLDGWKNRRARNWNTWSRLRVGLMR